MAFENLGAKLVSAAMDTAKFALKGGQQKLGEDAAADAIRAARLAADRLTLSRPFVTRVPGTNIYEESVVVRLSNGAPMFRTRVFEGFGLP